MRVRNLLFGELRFLWKYGIIFLYGIFTVIYLSLLMVVPQSAKQIVAIILVFTDPAAMGLFFMGAVVLLEKSQRVNSSLAVAPIKTGEYIAAKVMALAIMGVIVGGAIAKFVDINNMWLVILGIGLSSALFSLCGLLVATKIESLNSFMIAVVPFEIIICVVPILYILGIIGGNWWILHPGVAAIRMVSGDTGLWYLDIASIGFWSVIIFYFCHGAVKKYFCQMGGMAL